MDEEFEKKTCDRCSANEVETGRRIEKIDTLTQEVSDLEIALQERIESDYSQKKMIGDLESNLLQFKDNAEFYR